jgi:hypothetical protein
MDYKRRRNLSLIAIPVCAVAAWVGLAVGQRYSHPGAWFVAIGIPWFAAAMRRGIFSRSMDATRAGAKLLALWAREIFEWVRLGRA